MVVLHVKKNDSLFLLETKLDASVDATLDTILCIYNGSLKIARICSEMTDLARHGKSANKYLPKEIVSRSTCT